MHLIDNFSGHFHFDIALSGSGIWANLMRLFDNRLYLLSRQISIFGDHMDFPTQEFDKVVS